MRRGQIASEEEVAGAGREAFRGAAHGAAIWGIFGITAAGVGYAFSPIYRGLTIQFKVYLQMSCMTIGGCLEAERRVRDYEAVARRYRRVRKDQELWRQYEDSHREGNGDERAVGSVPAVEESVTTNKSTSRRS